MKDKYKTKKELIRELEGLRRITGIEGTQNTPDRLKPRLCTEDISYKAFYESSPLMYFTVDRAGTIVTVNPTGAAQLGYSGDDLVGDSVLKVFYNDDRDGVSKQVEKCFKNPGKLYDWEIRKIKKDGSVIWVKELARTIKDENGRALTTIVCEDITERKQAEFLLSTEKEVFGMIARNAPLPEILNTLCLEIERQFKGMLCSFLLLDENGANLRHGAAPGLPRSYIKAIDGVEIGPSVGSCGTAAYRKEPVIVSDIATDPLWSDYRDLALKHGLKSCWSTPIISTDGRVLGTFAMYYGDTRSPSPHEIKIIASATHLARLAIERLRSQELAFRFGEILEESLNEIYIFDAENMRYMQVNKGARKNLGYTLEELRHMTPPDLQPEMNAKDFKKRAKPLISGKEEKIRYTTVHRRKDGSSYPAEVYLQISDFKGKKVFVANVLDITGQKEKEEELKEKVEQLSKKNRYESIIRTITESVHQSLDLQEVFDNTVDALNKNVEGAQHVVLFMVEGKDAVLKANKGHADWYIKQVNESHIRKVQRGKQLLAANPATCRIRIRIDS